MVRPMPLPLPFHLIPFDFRFSLVFFFYSFICVYVCFPLPMFVIQVYVSRKGMLGFNKLHFEDQYTCVLVLNRGSSWSILYTLCLFSFFVFFFCLLEGLCYFWCQFPSQLVRNDKGSLSICLFVCVSVGLTTCIVSYSLLTLPRVIFCRFFHFFFSCLFFFSLFFFLYFFLRWGGGDKRNNNYNNKRFSKRRNQTIVH